MGGLSLVPFLCFFMALTFFVSVKSERDVVMNKCLELGNSVTQCEKLFE